MKYRMSWAQADGTKVENQIYTADFITSRLLSLEKQGCKNIKIESIEG